MGDRIGAGFEALRKQAKRWLAALRAGDREALARLAKVLPRHSEAPGLREVQQALAREQGFASWALLKEHHELLAVAARGQAALLDELLQNACIFSGGPIDLPQKWRRAQRIVALHPELATASIHAAVVCDRLDHVEASLQRDPSLATKRGGPQDWEPLLFLCYSRMPSQHGVAIAERLLDAGADAGTSFVHPEGDLRFFALTGVMGHGEMGSPEHPQADALARLLLARGANPNDSQGLYNTHLGDDDTKWLALLVAHGLGPNDRCNWNADPADVAKADPIFTYLVAQAAANGHVRRLTLLLEHGADANARSVYDGKSCWQAAMIAGRRDLADLLAKHGARTEPLEGVDAFVSACNQGDRERATALFEPAFVERSDALLDAALHHRHEAVAIMLALGADPNRKDRHGRLALHMTCDDDVLVELLLRHGADPGARCYGGTAAGWARQHDLHARAREFAERTRSLADAVLAGHVALARELVADDPSRARAREPDGATPLHLLPGDPEQARALVDLLLANGADANAVDAQGRTPADRLAAIGLDEIADLLP